MIIKQLENRHITRQRGKMNFRPHTEKKLQRSTNDSDGMCADRSFESPYIG